MSRADVPTPPVVNDLSQAPQTSPAVRDDRRAPDGPSVRAYYDDVITLPGFGDQPDRCIPLSPVGFCESGHPVLGASSCGVRRCPKHWRDWIEQAVINQVARLAAYRHLQEGAGKRVVHAVASPPQDRWYSTREFWAARSESYDALKACGMRGGVVVPHPYRSSEAGDHLFETAVEYGDWEEDRGKWSLFRDAAGDDWEEIQQYVEAGPHYHAIGPCEWFESEQRPEGWTLKNIRALPRFHIGDLESYRAMARPTYYLLTHGAVQQGRQTVTHFGVVHGATFSPEEDLSAREWEQIQTMAETAVTTRPAETRGAGPVEAEPQTCPRDDCDELVIDVMRLSEYLANESWVGTLKTRQRHQLRGIEVLLDGRADRPPPGIQHSEPQLLEWFEQVGRLHEPPAWQGRLAGWT